LNFINFGDFIFFDIGRGRAGLLDAVYAVGNFGTFTFCQAHRILNSRESPDGEDVLSLVFPLIRHMNQGIEACTIQIASNDRLELFLVELDYFADCFTQERPAVPWLADNKSGSSRFAVLKAVYLLLCNEQSLCQYHPCPTFPRYGIRLFFRQELFQNNSPTQTDHCLLTFLLTSTPRMWHPSQTA